MLLEKQLVVNVSSSTGKSAKRSRGAQIVSEATETWVETSRSVLLTDTHTCAHIPHTKTHFPCFFTNVPTFWFCWRLSYLIHVLCTYMYMHVLYSECIILDMCVCV